MKLPRKELLGNRINSNKCYSHVLESHMETMTLSGGSVGHLESTKHHDLSQSQHKGHTQSQKLN